MKTISIKLLLLILFTSCSSIKSQKEIKADYDNGFESKSKVKDHFRFDKIEKHSWFSISEEKPEGDSSLKITINKGDSGFIIPDKKYLCKYKVSEMDQE